MWSTINSDKIWVILTNKIPPHVSQTTELSASLRKREYFWVCTCSCVFFPWWGEHPFPHQTPDNPPTRLHLQSASPPLHPPFPPLLLSHFHLSAPRPVSPFSFNFREYFAFHVGLEQLLLTHTWACVAQRILYKNKLPFKSTVSLWFAVL